MKYQLHNRSYICRSCGKETIQDVWECSCGCMSILEVWEDGDLYKISGLEIIKHEVLHLPKRN